MGEEEHKLTSQNSTLPWVDYFIISRASDSFKERIDWMVEFQTYGSGKQNKTGYRICFLNQTIGITLGWVFRKAESEAEACAANRRKSAPGKLERGTGEWSRETGEAENGLLQSQPPLNVTDCPLSLDHPLRS